MGSIWKPQGNHLFCGSRCMETRRKPCGNQQETIYLIAESCISLGLYYNTTCKKWSTPGLPGLLKNSRILRGSGGFHPPPRRPALKLHGVNVGISQYHSLVLRLLLGTLNTGPVQMTDCCLTPRPQHGPCSNDELLFPQD